MFSGFLFVQLMRQQCGRLHMKLNSLVSEQETSLSVKAAKVDDAASLKKCRPDISFKTPFTV